MSIKNSETPDNSKETPPKPFKEKIELMRQEFEELLFLKQAAETLRNFRTRLIQERWD